MLLTRSARNVATFQNLNLLRMITSAKSVESKTKIKDQFATETNPLIDTFGRHHTYLRISLTERCNLRSQLQEYHTMRNNYVLNLLKNPNTSQANALRHYSSHKKPDQLTHIDKDGKASMVDVSHKESTVRNATARAVVKINHQITELIKSNGMKKGDVLSIAQIAGIIGAKKTSEIIPLCHNIPLSSIKVTAHLDSTQKSVLLNATVKCIGKTGVEMEALTAVSIAALTVYDMCKSISHNIQIKDIYLVSKSGGVSGDYKSDEVVVREYETSPIVKEQVFLSNV